MHTCINVVDFDSGVKTTDGKIGVDFVELDVDDAHAVSGVN